MATDLDQTVIESQRRYWYSRIPFTSTDSIAAGNTRTFTTLQGWNTSEDLATQVGIRTVGATQDPNVQYQATADSTPSQWYADSQRPGLAPIDVGAYATQNLSLAFTNQGSGATVNTQTIYTADIWQLPVANRIMRNLPLPEDLKALAASVGLDLDPNAMQGTFPLPIGTVIERTYANRRIGPDIAFGGKAPTPTKSDQIFMTLTRSSPNEMFVVRAIGARAPDGPDYGVRIRVDQDNNNQLVDLDASLLSLDHPTDLFLPATRRLNFHIICTQADAPGPVPVRVEVWRVSLSAILRVRMGLQSLSQLIAAMGGRTGKGSTSEQQTLARAAGALYTRILAGVK